MASRRSDHEGEGKAIGAWVAQHGIAALSIVGALLYGTARLSYVSFYREFGLDPEDVGIGYAATLARAVPGLLVKFAFVLVIFGGGIYGLAYFASIVAREPARLADLWRAGKRATVFYLSVGIAFLLLVITPDGAKEQAADVKRGEELHASGHVLSRAIYDNPLGLNAHAVEVEWVDRAQAPTVELGASLMLLGSAGGTHYLFDVEHGRTVRIPAALVVLSETEPSNVAR